jgi:hypothetical protein
MNLGDISKHVNHALGTFPLKNGCSGSKYDRSFVLYATEMPHSGRTGLIGDRPGPTRDLY